MGDINEGMRTASLLIAFALCASLAAACQPGLGAQVASRDFAHTVAQRDQRAVESSCTEAFRKAVWDRVSANEFPVIAALMGHGEHLEPVLHDFLDQEAYILVRSESPNSWGTKQQYRLHVVHQDSDWFIDDVLKETALEKFASMPLQAEAVLAVRDFRQALRSGDVQAIRNTSSEGFRREAWDRVGAEQLGELKPTLSQLSDASGGTLGLLFKSRAGTLGAKVAGTDSSPTFYFVSEGGRLVVDDMSVPGDKDPLRVRLRNQTQAPVPPRK